MTPAERSADHRLREALEQALDRFDTIGDHLKPDATDDDRDAVAQAWWFGSEELLAVLSEATPSSEPDLDVERLRTAHRNLFMLTGHGLFAGYVDELAAEYARLSASQTPEPDIK